MASRRLPLLLAAALPLAGCATGPEYKPATASELGVPDAYSVPADMAAPQDMSRWWTNFDDPMLASLVERGRTANLDGRIAIARLRQSREALLQARTAFLPSIGASAGYSRNVTVAGQNLGNDDSFSIGADVSYQVDLFGGLSSSVQAAQAQYQASGYDYAAILISVEGEIARNYVLARLAQAQLANARASLGIQDENLDIAGWRVQAGLVSSLDVEQARAARAQTAATIPSLEANYNATVSRLAVLLGLPPGALKAELETPHPIPRGPERIAVGIPADTLRQRPDIRSAERNLAAASAQIGVATAQLFPALSIGGNLDSGFAGISTIGDLITGRLFAGLTQVLFDGGRRQSQVRSARAAAEAAYLTYQRSVLSALEDVENALFAYQAAQRREAEFETALDAANNTAIIARSQYRAGLTDFTTLNQAEAALLSARNGLDQARADKATALIQLYLALGGGWDARAIPDAIETPVILPTSQDR